MKQIPNLFTLLNLIFGCIAIVYMLEPGLILLPLDDEGNLLVPPRQLDYVPEKIIWASAFIGMAAVVDFLDGLIARAFKSTSELGKQLDSLADVVSFGVAPSMIVYHFLKLSYAQHRGGLDTSFFWLTPAFVIAGAAAYRLGKFNLDKEQAFHFKGVPTPAAGLLVASLPLIYWYNANLGITGLFLNKWFWYGFIALISYLMVSNLPIMSLKFKDLSIRNNIPKLVLLLLSVALILFLKWLAVPAIFIVYIAVSLAFKTKSA